MRIALIDDDQNFREQFQMQLQQEMRLIGIQNCRIDCFGSGEEYIAVSGTSKAYTLLFTEILLPDMNGIELAGKLSEYSQSLPVIFVSRVNDFASETYEVGAAYYLIKPVNSEALRRMFSRLIREYRMFSERVTFPDGFACSVQDIVYIKQQRQKSLLYLNGESAHVSACEISELRHLLDLYPFFYEVDQGVIVNLKQVREMNKAVLQLQNGHYITIPRRRMKEISEVFSDVLFRCHEANGREKIAR